MHRANLATIVMLALAACGGDEASNVALGTLERDRLELPAEAHEPVIEILVGEGEHVSEGQVLLRLDTVNGLAQVANLKAQASEAQHRLDELIKGPRAEEILEARANLAGAEAQHEHDAKEYERIRELVPRKLASQSSLDQQRAARDNAEAAQRAAQAKLTLLLKGTRIEDLDQARDALAQAQAQLQQAETSAQRLTVRAPRPGVVEALPFKVGDRPPAGDPVIVMIADGTTYARVYVPEPMRVHVQAGTPATVRVDGEEQAFAATVRFVSNEASFTPYFALSQKDRSRLSYLAHVDLTEPRSAALPVGIPVEVHFGTTRQAAR